MNQAEGRFYPRVFGLVTAALLALALFEILRPFIGPMLWSVLLALLLFPLNQALRWALGGRPAAAAALLTLGVILLLVGPALFLAVAFTRQAADLFARLQTAAGQLETIRLGDLLRLPGIERIVGWAGSMAPISAEQFEAWLVGAAKTLVGALVLMSGAFVVGALGTLVAALALLRFAGEWRSHEPAKAS